jgi:hypothetical protein
MNAITAIAALATAISVATVITIIVSDWRKSVGPTLPRNRPANLRGDYPRVPDEAKSAHGKGR